MPLSRGKDKSLRNHRHTRTLEQYPIVRFYQLLHEVTELLHEVTRLCNPLGKPAIDNNAPLRPSSVSASLSGWRRSPSISIKVVSFVPKRQPARGVVARCGGETRRASQRARPSPTCHDWRRWRPGQGDQLGFACPGTSCDGHAVRNVCVKLSDSDSDIDARCDSTDTW